MYHTLFVFADLSPLVSFSGNSNVRDLWQLSFCHDGHLAGRYLFSVFSNGRDGDSTFLMCGDIAVFIDGHYLRR